MKKRVIGVAVVLLVVGLGAGAEMQRAPAGAGALKFEVASVKENKLGGRNMMWGCHGTDGTTWDHQRAGGGASEIPMGRCVVRNVPVQWVIALAYGIPWDRENQVILGGPQWVSAGLDSSVRVDIDADAGRPATRAELFKMLQALLADRFQMKIHEEQRPMLVYELRVAKGGPKLTKAPAGRDCSVLENGVPCHDFTGAGGGLSGRSVTMAEFASRLTRYPGHLVVDKTGLSGDYDIKTGPFWMPFPDSTDPGTPTIFNMLKDQMGLEMKEAKGPVPVLVVDSAQRPTAN